MTHPQYGLITLRREPGVYEGDRVWTCDPVCTLRELDELQTRLGGQAVRLIPAGDELQAHRAMAAAGRVKSKEDQLKALCKELGYEVPRRKKGVSP